MALGMTVEELGYFLDRKSIYHYSMALRAKLSIPDNKNINTTIRKLLDETDSHTSA